MTSNAVQIKLSTNPEMLSARTAGICIRVHVDGRRGASDRSGDGESHLLMFILRFVGRVCGVRSSSSAPILASRTRTRTSSSENQPSTNPSSPSEPVTKHGMK